MLKNEFNSLAELTDFFKDEETCRKYLAEKRWGNKPYCPCCGCQKVYCFSDGKRYKCSSCRKQFTVRAGSIFEDSKVPLRKWFITLYLIATHKKGISSHQLARDRGVTQKTAWYMLSKIRFALDESNIESQLSDTVELDETFVGGKNKNRHWDKKVPHSQGRSFKDKTPVFGMLQRGGKVIAKVVPDTKAKTLNPLIKQYIAKGSTICTDDWYYGNLSKDYNHLQVDHSAKVYAIGNNYTNTIEGFWSQLKRSILGIYHVTSRKHLQKYVNEMCFRYNYRKLKQGERVNKMLSLCWNRITYKELVYE